MTPHQQWAGHSLKVGENPAINAHVINELKIKCILKSHILALLQIISSPWHLYFHIQFNVGNNYVQTASLNTLYCRAAYINGAWGGHTWTFQDVGVAVM